MRFARNTKTLSLTTKMLNFAKSPTGIITIVGSYPFSMFIKEEAIQTIGMGFWQASQNNDLAGMESALQEQADILDPGTWEKLISLVPYANTIKQLKDFFKTAIIKLKIDRGIFEKMKNEEPEEDKWLRIFEEQRIRKEEERTADEEYYAGVQDSMKRARDEQRAEDEIYWNDIRTENKKREEQKRKEDEEYWANIRKNVDDWNAGKSQLDFGLL